MDVAESNGFSYNMDAFPVMERTVFLEPRCHLLIRIVFRPSGALPRFAGKRHLSPILHSNRHKCRLECTLVYRKELNYASTLRVEA